MTWLTLALLLLAVGCGGSDNSTEPAVVGPITVGEVWAPATVDAAVNGAVYVELTAEADDSLVGAEVARDIAGAVTLHETVTEHDGHGADAGMVMMNSIERLELPAGETIALEPGGAHLMLVDLARPLRADAPFDVTLRFESAYDVVVEVAVRES